MGVLPQCTSGIRTAATHRGRDATQDCKLGRSLDMRVSGFWGSIHKSAFFDMRVFNPYALSKSQTLPSSSVQKAWDGEAKILWTKNTWSRAQFIYPSCVLSSGGHGYSSQCVLQETGIYASGEASANVRKDHRVAAVHLSFSLMRSTLMCIQGARSTWKRPDCTIHTTLFLSYCMFMHIIWSSLWTQAVRMCA